MSYEDWLTQEQEAVARKTAAEVQDRELKAINKAGGFAIVVDSVEQLKSLGG